MTNLSVYTANREVDGRTPQEIYSWLARRHPIRPAIDQLTAEERARLIAYATAHLERCWSDIADSTLLRAAVEIAGRYRHGSLNPDTDLYKQLMSELVRQVDIARRDQVIP